MLIGEKVTLRALERADLPALHALKRHVDLVVLGNGHWEPESLASWEAHFDKHVADEEPARFVIQAGAALIGTIGLHHSDRRNGTSEFGIGIYDPSYLSQGYGREAIKLLLDWAFRIQNYRRIWLSTTANNLRAIRAYESCGFVVEGRLRDHVFADGAYVDVVHMGILRSEWAARQAEPARA